MEGRGGMGGTGRLSSGILPCQTSGSTTAEAGCSLAEVSLEVRKPPVTSGCNRKQRQHGRVWWHANLRQVNESRTMVMVMMVVVFVRVPGEVDVIMPVGIMMLVAAHPNGRAGNGGGRCWCRRSHDLPRLCGVQM